jgi:hypothetical protein
VRLPHLPGSPCLPRGHGRNKRQILVQLLCPPSTLLCDLFCHGNREPWVSIILERISLAR